MRLSNRTLLSRSFNRDTGWPIMLILTIWALVNALLIFKQGIVTTGEAAKYIDEAHYFLEHGSLPSSNFRYYSIIILLLSLCFKFHVSIAAVVTLQMLLNLAATLFFYSTLKRILHARKAALAATLLLLLNYPYQAFNTAVQSESLFQSMSLLLSCYILQHGSFKAKHLFLMVCAIFVLTLSRPLGLLYLPAAFIYFYLTSLRQLTLSKQLAFLAMTALVFLYFLNDAMTSGGEYDFVLPFREEHIICGTPTLLNAAPTTEKSSSIFALVHYIFNNMGQFLRLAWLKTVSFWGIYRSYFSIRHNIPLLVYFYSIIAMAACSLSWWRRHHPYRLAYLLTLILITWTTVILTCDDWNHRIFLSISPYLIMLSAGWAKRIFSS